MRQSIRHAGLYGLDAAAERIGVEVAELEAADARGELRLFRPLPDARPTVRGDYLLGWVRRYRPELLGHIRISPPSPMDVRPRRSMGFAAMKEAWRDTVHRRHGGAENAEIHT